MKKTIFILVAMCLSLVSYSQTVLEEGDIAFVAINSDGPTDDFSFLLLTDVTVGTEINFTDNGWSVTGEFNPDYPESHFKWEATGLLEAGKVVRIKTHNGIKLPEASAGSVTGEKMTLSVAGDQLLAYQGDKSNPKFIAAISYNQNWIDKPQYSFDEHSYSNSTSDLPSNLTIGVNALHVYNKFTYMENDNAIYCCEAPTKGTKEFLLSEINNVMNWETDNSVPIAQDPFPCEFIVDLSTIAGAMPIEKMDIYPVPATSDITLKVITNTDLLGYIYSSTGVLVKQFVYPAYVNEYEVSVDDLSKGVYILKLQNAAHKASGKIVINP